MIVRNCLAWALISLSFLSGSVRADRWSRQVSNSEWIPLANPRAAQTHLPLPPPQLPQLSHPIPLPPQLQQQYQQQLIQLQKTQENIQRLLILQQQLRSQQELLQQQQQQDFANPEEQNKALQQSAISNLQNSGELGGEVLLPPIPSSDALPPVYPPQDFHPQGKQEDLPRNPQVVQDQSFIRDSNLHQDEFQLEGLQEEPKEFLKQGKYPVGPKHLKRPSSQANLVAQIVPGAGLDDEEIQLVYVPAETLSNRNQGKRPRGRKQFSNRPEQRPAAAAPTQFQHESEEQEQNHSADEEAFARQLLHQIEQQGQDEKNDFLKEKKAKEKSRLIKEAEEQEEREAERKRKELEESKIRESERIREIREKQRRLEERRRYDEEIRQREIEGLERQRQLEESRREEQRQAAAHQQHHHHHQDERGGNDGETSQISQIREQKPSRQYHTEVSSRVKVNRVRPRNRNKSRPPQEQLEVRGEPATTPSPNQPPLSVYMGSNSQNVKVTDVLRLLKDAKTIAVLDTVGPGAPQVFVGPSNLQPAAGYTKFDLPYLSSLDHNRVERKVDRLPFFVAPLSFQPPSGYSKIPFPAPHIGSVVVNNLQEVSDFHSRLNNDQDQQHNPNPTPLIEPNSYIDGGNSDATAIRDEEHSISSTTTLGSSTTPTYNQEPSSTTKYDPSSSSEAGKPTARHRFRQYYENKSTQGPSSSSSASYRESPSTTTRGKFYEDNGATPSYPQTSSVVTTVSYNDQDLYQTTLPIYRKQNVDERELPQHREVLLHKYQSAERYNPRHRAQGPINSYEGGEASDNEDVRNAVGPTQYSLPVDLPAISPHLPGLVNSLVEGRDGSLSSPFPTLVPVTATPKTTTTTTATTTTTSAASYPTATTQKHSSTTYRSRGRQRGRVVATRTTTTTQAPLAKSTVDRSRRPYNRSRTRPTTTTSSSRITDDYRDSSYDPTRGKAQEAITLRYNPEQQRRTTVLRNQKPRTKERPNEETRSSNPAILTSSDYAQSSLSTSSGLRETTSPSFTSYLQNDYPSATTTQIDNYPFRDPIRNHAPPPLVSEDYSKSQNYHQHRPAQESSHFQPNLEINPVNGFNYQIRDEEHVQQRPNKDYPYYSGKPESSGDVGASSSTAEDSRQSEDAQYHSSTYEIRPTDLGENRQSSETTVFTSSTPEKDFPIQHSTAFVEATTPEATTTTDAPVIIRQRVRARLGGRNHQDSAIQTRPRGSQDEYVRFSVVNQAPVTRSSSSNDRNRDGSRTKTRSRPQSHVQTEGNEYVRIQAQRPTAKSIVSASKSPSDAHSIYDEDNDDDVEDNDDGGDYGFIRTPNFRGTNSESTRPSWSGHRQSIGSSEQVQETMQKTEKSRPKYQNGSTRRPAIKSNLFQGVASAERPTTERISLSSDEDTVYSIKSRSKEEAKDNKPTRSRGRVRRPGRQRVQTTTSTTESPLDANNELPLDENYPRIRQPQQQDLGVETERQQFELPQELPNKFPKVHHFNVDAANYPHDFILNFGPLPGTTDYDQGHHLGNTEVKYNVDQHRLPVESEGSTGDIYGAESQWSTKLTRTSFQPSFSPNRLVDTLLKSREYEEPGRKAPEIITAGPEAASVTVLVSSDLGRSSEIAEPEMAPTATTTTATTFGKRINMADFTERVNLTSVSIEDQATGSDEESNENEKFVKKIIDPVTGRKTIRRKRVRVRIRPINDEFVTAESQHSSKQVMNSYKDTEELRHAAPTTTEVPLAMTTIPQSFDEFPGVQIIPTTTEQLPVDAWTTTTTTLENNETTMTEDLELATTPLPFSSINFLNRNEPTSTLIHSSHQHELFVSGKTDQSSSSQEPTDTIISKLVDSTTTSATTTVETSRNDESTVADFETTQTPPRWPSYPVPAQREPIDYITGDEDGRSKFKDEQLKKQISEYPPKNHRSEYGEVRYHVDKSTVYSKFPKTSWGFGKEDSTEATDERIESQSEKTLTDYVQAIFDSMKSADEIGAEGTIGVNGTSGTKLRTSPTREASITEETTKLLSEQLEETTRDPPEVSSKSTTTTTSPNLNDKEKSSVNLAPSSSTLTVNSGLTKLGKVLRTSTTTKVSHMTEICYRGRCVMTKPKRR